MDADRVMRRALWVTAPANVAVAGLMLFPDSLPGLIVGLPEPPPHVLYRAVLATVIGLFGGTYVWLALQPIISRPLVGFGAVGKTAFALVTLSLWVAGSVSWRFALLASGDLLFAAIFVWWLSRDTAARPA